MKMKTRNDFEMPLAGDVMQKNVMTIHADAPIEEIAQQLTTKMISGAPVVDDEENVLGVVSLSDIACHASHPQTAVPKNYYRDLWMEEEVADGYLIEGESQSVKARDIMTPVVHKARIDDPIPEVVRLMLQARIHRVLISNGREIVGIITTTDLVRMLPELLHSLIER